MIPSRTLLLAALMAALPIAASAQTPSASVQGRIVGPDNAAVAGQDVVLHRVSNATGETIATTVTAEDGSFVLEYPLAADTSALYFVAARYEGELYIGPPFRAGERTPAGQLIQVGVPGTSATAMFEDGGSAMARPAGRPVTSRNWLLLVIPLVGVAAVGIYALVPRSRIAPERALLIRIAELDERMTSAPAAQRESLLEERTRLTAQLRGG
jgi:hypothetical protein